jgi:aminocarboxymuconate-semialdehyde decarboxylase
MKSQSASDVVFVGCTVSSATPGYAEAPAGGRRQVVVNGKRVKTVDVHAHCAVPAANALVGRQLESSALLKEDIPTRLRAMDAQGIDVEALSINPYWYKADREVAAKLIQLQNEALAEFCATHPDRFVAFATVALQHPDLAVQQLVDGVKKYNLRGAGTGGSVDGKELSDPKFTPFWAKAEELGVLIFIHPQGTAELEASGRLGGNGLLTNTIGNPLETTIALSHLIFEGTLDQFPGLKICAAHGGGYLPSYMNRSDAVQTTFPQRQTRTLKKRPTEYVKQMYYDSIVFTGEALRHLAAEAGPGQVVMGTDYPFPWTSTSVDHILNTPGLSDAEKVAMLGGTAQKLLGIQG